MIEEWRSLSGYENIYEISNFGEVRRLRKTNSGDIGSVLKPAVDRVGYKRVRLCKDGKVNAMAVHRLVATVFLGEHDGEVNHINGIKGDNRACNLEWCSHKENMSKAVEANLIKTKPLRQMLCGKEVAAFSSLAEAATRTGFDKGNISACCRGKRKTAHGFEWEWVETLPHSEFITGKG